MIFIVYGGGEVTRGGRPCRRRRRSAACWRSRSPGCSCVRGRRRSWPRSGAWSAGVIASPPQLDDPSCRAGPGARPTGAGAGDALAAEVGAVGAADVLDEPLLTVGGEPGVPGGHVVVVEPDAASVPRPSRIGCSLSGTLWPALGPETTSLVGTPGRACGTWAAWPASGPWASCRAWRPLLARRRAVPKTSDRMTDTADSTNSHSTARKPSLINVSVSSDMSDSSSRRCGSRSE